MKKWISMLLAVIMVISLAACGKKEDSSKTDDSQTPVEDTNRELIPVDEVEPAQKLFDTIANETASSVNDRLRIIIDAVREDEEMRETFPVETDADAASLIVLGIEPEDLEEYGIAFSRMNVHAYMVGLMKPVTGKEAEVKDKIKVYRDSVIESFEKYLPDQYEIANKSVIFDNAGYLGLVMCENSDEVSNNLTELLKDIDKLEIIEVPAVVEDPSGESNEDVTTDDTPSEDTSIEDTPSEDVADTEVASEDSTGGESSNTVENTESTENANQSESDEHQAEEQQGIEQQGAEQQVEVPVDESQKGTEDTKETENSQEVVEQTAEESVQTTEEATPSDIIEDTGDNGDEDVAEDLGTDKIPNIGPEKVSKSSDDISIELLVELAQLGDELTWDHFSEYYYEDLGGEEFICKYGVNDKVYLVIGGMDLDLPPEYIRLVSVDDENNYIDIRYEDIETFIGSLY